MASLVYIKNGLPVRVYIHGLGNHPSVSYKSNRWHDIPLKDEIFASVQVANPMKSFPVWIILSFLWTRKVLKPDLQFAPVLVEEIRDIIRSYTFIEIGNGNFQLISKTLGYVCLLVILFVFD